MKPERLRTPSRRAFRCGQLRRIDTGSRSASRNDNRVGHAATERVGNLVAEGAGRESGGMFDVDVGQNFHGLGSQAGALSQELVGDALDHALIGDSGPGQDVYPEELRADRGRDAERRDAVVAEHVDAQWHVVRPFDLGGKRGHRRDDVRRNRGGEERRVAEVFHDEPVTTARDQGFSVLQKAVPNGGERSGTRRSGKRCCGR